MSRFTKDVIFEALNVHKTQEKAAKFLGCSRSTFSEYLNKYRQEELNATSVKKIGHSLDEFRETYDKNTIIPLRINTALEQLKKSNSWMYEIEFIKLANVSTIDLATFRDQFEQNWISVNRGSSKRVWASVDLINLLKEML